MYVFSPLKVILVQQETGRAKRQFPPLLLGLCQEQLCQQFPAASLRQTSAFFIVRFFSCVFFFLFYFLFFLSPGELSISTKRLASISRPRWLARAPQGHAGLLSTPALCSLRRPVRWETHTGIPARELGPLRPAASPIPGPTSLCPAGRTHCPVGVQMGC